MEKYLQGTKLGGINFKFNIKQEGKIKISTINLQIALSTGVNGICMRRESILFLTTT